ncbi:HU family DNA-binding protein [bacterium]|nr:HU family DNA-binding protein [bacterium]
MKREDLIKVIADHAGVTKKQADAALKAMLTGITKALKKGDKVTFVGFGSFSVVQRKARDGRNPRTGKKIRIPATKVPKFSAGKALKDSVK